MNSDRSAYPPAVVLGLGATAIAVGRILGRRGVSVYGADVDKGTPGRFSKHIRRPPFGYFADGERLVQGLVEFARGRGDRPVLLATSDAYIEFLGRHAGALRLHYSFQSFYQPELADPFLNKRSFYRLCLGRGIAIPRFMEFGGDDSPEDILHAIGLPLIVKPALIHRWKRRLRGQKVVLVESPEELRRLLREQADLFRASLIQEVVPGPEDNLYIYKGYFEERTGRCMAEFVGRKIRQCPPDFGSASFAVAVENEDVRRISRDFLESCGFRGLCGAEYKFDPRDSSYKMIEVNIRPQIWEDLTRVSGPEIVWAAYCDLTGLPVDLPHGQVNGASWSYLFRDLYSGVHFVRKGDLTIRKWLRSYRKWGTDAVLDRRDVWGSVGALWAQVRQIFGFMRSD
jgi:D-aspartate ligase